MRTGRRLLLPDELVGRTAWRGCCSSLSPRWDQLGRIGGVLLVACLRRVDVAVGADAALFRKLYLETVR